MKDDMQDNDIQILIKDYLQIKREKNIDKLTVYCINIIILCTCFYLVFNIYS